MLDRATRGRPRRSTAGECDLAAARQRSGRRAPMRASANSSTCRSAASKASARCWRGWRANYITTAGRVGHLRRPGPRREAGRAIGNPQVPLHGNRSRVANDAMDVHGGKGIIARAKVTTSAGPTRRIPIAIHGRGCQYPDAQSDYIPVRARYPLPSFRAERDGSRRRPRLRTQFDGTSTDHLFGHVSVTR